MFKLVKKSDWEKLQRQLNKNFGAVIESVTDLTERQDDLESQSEEHQKKIAQLDSSMSALVFYQEFGRFIKSTEPAEAQCKAVILQLASAVSPEHRVAIEEVLDKLEEKG